MHRARSIEHTRSVRVCWPRMHGACTPHPMTLPGACMHGLRQWSANGPESPQGCSPVSLREIPPLKCAEHAVRGPTRPASSRRAGRRSYLDQLDVDRGLSLARQQLRLAEQPADIDEGVGLPLRSRAWYSPRRCLLTKHCTPRVSRRSCDDPKE